MKNRLTKYLLGCAAVTLLSTGCEIFEDQTPETISFRMDGSADEPVMVIYSTEFIAGVNQDTGLTRVEVFGSDTVMYSLPVDTVIDVSALNEKQMLIIVQPQASDTISVDVRVDVNDRALVDDEGRIYPEDPWSFLYRFNAPFTADVEIII